VIVAALPRHRIIRSISGYLSVYKATVGLAQPPAIGTGTLQWLGAKVCDEDVRFAGQSFDHLLCLP
jgi:hypothetical protein